MAARTREEQLEEQITRILGENLGIGTDDELRQSLLHIIQPEQYPQPQRLVQNLPISDEDEAEEHDEVIVSCHCGDCHRAMTEDDEQFSVSYLETNDQATSEQCIVCDSCRENYCACEDCDSVVPSGSTWSTSNGTTICDDCRNNNYSRCEGCDEIVNDDDMYENYCSSCSDNDEEVDDDDHTNIPNRDHEQRHPDYITEEMALARGLNQEIRAHLNGYRNALKQVQSYGFKPSGIFDIGTKNKEVLTMSSRYTSIGVELEHDVANTHSSVFVELKEKFLKDRLYYKSDSSLNNGIELVSHPTTLGAFKWKEWKALLEAMQSSGACIPNTYPIGLHVHVSMNGASKHKLNAKCTMFGNLLAKELLKLSGRRADYMERYAAPNNCDIEKILYAYKRQNIVNGGRRYAFNVEHTTLEYRFFKGTVDYNEFSNCVRFCAYFTDFIKQTSLTFLIHHKPKEVWLEMLSYMPKEVVEFVNARVNIEDISDTCQAKETYKMYKDREAIKLSYNRKLAAIISCASMEEGIAYVNHDRANQTFVDDYSLSLLYKQFQDKRDVVVQELATQYGVESESVTRQIDNYGRDRGAVLEMLNGRGFETDHRGSGSMHQFKDFITVLRDALDGKCQVIKCSTYCGGMNIGHQMHLQEGNNYRLHSTYPSFLLGSNGASVAIETERLSMEIRVQYKATEDREEYSTMCYDNVLVPLEIFRALDMHKLDWKREATYSSQHKLTFGNKNARNRYDERPKSSQYKCNEDFKAFMLPLVVETYGYLHKRYLFTIHDAETVGYNEYDESAPFPDNLQLPIVNYIAGTPMSMARDLAERVQAGQYRVPREKYLSMRANCEEVIRQPIDDVVLPRRARELVNHLVHQKNSDKRKVDIMFSQRAFTGRLSVEDLVSNLCRYNCKQLLDYCKTNDGIDREEARLEYVNLENATEPNGNTLYGTIHDITDRDSLADKRWCKQMVVDMLARCEQYCRDNPGNGNRDYRSNRVVSTARPVSSTSFSRFATGWDYTPPF